MCTRISFGILNATRFNMMVDELITDNIKSFSKFTKMQKLNDDSTFQDGLTNSWCLSTLHMLRLVNEIKQMRQKNDVC